MRGFAALRTLRILILEALVVFAVAGAASAFELKYLYQTPSAQGEKTNTTVTPPSGRQIINIVFSKMEDGYIYAESGDKYKIDSSTKIINNTSSTTNMKIAELVFVSGTLTSITFK